MKLRGRTGALDMQGEGDSVLGVEADASPNLSTGGSTGKQGAEIRETAGVDTFHRVVRVEPRSSRGMRTLGRSGI